MKISNYKTRQAEGVLKAVEKLSSKGEKTDLVKYMFANDREQGFILINQIEDDLNKMRSVAFAENRNSDEIVVYVHQGYLSDASQLTEEDYKLHKFFSPNDYIGAAKFIRSFLLVTEYLSE